MLLRTLLTTPLQTFCIKIFNFQVIVKYIFDPDENFKRDSYALIGDYDH